jgi:hypothetical protein
LAVQAKPREEQGVGKSFEVVHPDETESDSAFGIPSNDGVLGGRVFRVRLEEVAQFVHDSAVVDTREE